MRLFGSLTNLVKLIFKKDNNDVELRANNSTTYTATRTWDLPPGDVSGTIVGAATTQTLTSKTIDGDDNTVQDLPVTARKTVLSDANKVIVRDGSGVPGSALLVNANIDAAAAIAGSKITAASSTAVGVLKATSGTWAPSLDYISGVTMSSTIVQGAVYSLVDGVVTFSVVLDTTTSGVGAGVFSMSTPITTTFSGTWQALGVVYMGAQTPGASSSYPGYINSNNGSSLIYVNFYSYVGAAGIRCVITGSYRVI